jgi:orotate phosphoribosyltransferase
MDKVTILAKLLIDKLDCPAPDTIVAPAMGGLVLGQEVARQLKCRFLFLEKVDDQLALRRNFSLSSKDNILLVEDVVTKGGRVSEALTILRKTNCKICAVTSLVDRSTDELDFGVPFQPLLKLDFPTYDPNELPDDLKLLTPVKPGS